MKTLTQYIIKEFITPFFYTLSTLFLIYLIADLFEHMDEFLRAGLSLFQMTEYYFYMLPLIFVQIAPFAFVLSLIFELGIFARHNEVMAMKASGISPKRIAVPLLMMGFIISCVVLICDQYIIPRNQSKLLAYEKLQLDNKEEKKSRSNLDLTYYNLQHHYIFYIQELNNNTAKDVQVHHLRDDGTLEGCYRAKNAKWLDESWWFFDGSYIRYNQSGDMIAPSEFFEKKIMSYQESPNNLIHNKESSQMNFFEYRQVLKTQFGKEIPAAKIVGLHFKLSNSVACFVLGLLVIPFGLKIARSGAFSALGKTMLMTFGFYGVQTLFIILGKQEFILPFLSVWLTPIIFAGAGLHQVVKLK